MTPRLRNILAGFVTGAVTLFLTATILYGLLGRLGDTAGSTWAGRVAVVAAGVTLVALAFASLFESIDRREGEDARTE